MFRIAAATISIAATLVILASGQQSALTNLKTTAEASDYKSTSKYDEVVAFMKAVDQASPLVFMTTYGTTAEGRAMPLAVVGTGLKDGSAAAVKASGKLRVHIQANIHAGEVEGKEAALILLREFALGRHAEWLRSSVFLVTPIFNADGNEKFATNNRGPQNGPINGQGTRANGQNLNINRDFMKLDTPEGRAFVTLWNDYDPHVGFDLHTSDGSNHGYYLTYSPPLNPDTADAIMSLMKNEWFPFVTKTVKAQHGWDTFYYGNASSLGGRGARFGQTPPNADAPLGQPSAAATQTPPTTLRAWSTFEHLPRYHNNYVGLRNRFALLSEAYAYATFEDRINATRYFLDAALAFAHDNAARLKKIAADADQESIVGRSLATRSQLKRGGTIEVLMGEVEQERNPVSGQMMNRRKDVVHAEQMVDMLWFEPRTTEDVPAEFYVPATAAKALDLLRAHGVKMDHVTRFAGALPDQFEITSNTARPVSPNSIDTGQHGLRTLEGDWKPLTTWTGPVDYWRVSMKQPLARLAFYLLAPTSDDGLTAWNALDDLLTDAKTYPILRKR